MGRKFFVFLLFTFMPMYVWAANPYGCATFTTENACVGTSASPVLGCKWVQCNPNNDDNCAEPEFVCKACEMNEYGWKCQEECGQSEGTSGYNNAHRFGNNGSNLRGARTKYECYKSIITGTNTGCITGWNTSRTGYTYTSPCRAYFRDQYQDPYIVCGANNLTPGTSTTDGSITSTAEDSEYHLDSIDPNNSNNSIDYRDTCVKNEIPCYNILPPMLTFGTNLWKIEESLQQNAKYPLTDLPGQSENHKWDVSDCRYNSTGSAPFLVNGASPSEQNGMTVYVPVPANCYAQVKIKPKPISNSNNTFWRVSGGSSASPYQAYSDPMDDANYSFVMEYNCIGCDKGYNPDTSEGVLKCVHPDRGYYNDIACTDAYDSQENFFRPDGCTNSSHCRCTANGVAVNVQKACPVGMTTDGNSIVADNIGFCHYTNGASGTRFCDTSGCYYISNLNGWTFYNSPRSTFTCFNNNCVANIPGAD